jgi:hypothetical protein
MSKDKISEKEQAAQEQVSEEVQQAKKLGCGSAGRKWPRG